MSNRSPAQKNDSADTERYQEELDELNEAIDACRAKIESGRIYDEEHEKIKIKQWRALGYLIKTKHEIKKDQHLEELDEQVEEALAAEEQWPAISD